MLVQVRVTTQHSYLPNTNTYLNIRRRTWYLLGIPLFFSEAVL